MEKSEFEAMLTRAVEKAFVKQCACGLSTEAQHELAHFMGVVKHIGGEGQEGYAKGVEIIRENNRFVMKWRAACEKTGSIILCVIVAGVIGIVAAIGSAGWWTWIRRGGATIIQK